MNTAAHSAPVAANDTDPVVETITAGSGRINYRNTETLKGATVSPWDSNLTCFGFWSDSSESATFEPSRVKSSKGYKTTKMAKKQAQKWVSA